MLLFNCRNTREITLEEIHPPESYALDTLIELFVKKYGDFILKNQDSTLFPRTYEDGQIQLVSSTDWTSGFFPGILWYLYEYSGDTNILGAARAWTNTLSAQSLNTSTHDIGFIINSSFGQGYRLTNDESYKVILNAAASSLASRFNAGIGCIKSLDDLEGYSYPVLIDNMVNLEILYKAWRWNNDNGFYAVANEHALKTMEMHFRPDFSAFQVVDYDMSTSKAGYKGSFQGYSDSSSWARGQAWGLYGYVLAFKETKDRVFLDQAIRIGTYITGNPNLPDDFIPYWDFMDPDIPDAPRDAAAAAIIASAFMDMSSFSEVPQPERYFGAAVRIINSFVTKGYVAHIDECGSFMLKHCVGNMPGKMEVDVPIIYGDYYFLEALMKYKGIARK